MTDPDLYKLPPLTQSQLERVRRMQAESEARRTGAPLKPPTPKRTARRNPLVTKLKTLNRFLDRSAQQQPPVVALVWVQMLRDERDGEVRTAVSALVKRCGVSHRTAERALARLRADGYLTLKHKGSIWTGPTVYTLSATASDRADHAADGPSPAAGG